MKFKPGDRVYYRGFLGEKIFREVREVIGSEVWFTTGRWLDIKECFPVEVRKKGFAQWASDML